MGLFDKLFTKKICSVCGGEIGLLGNRKLEDGNLCKECAGKLSPWFSDRRNTTVEEIKEQLAYREANRAEVAAFRTTRTMGENTKVMLDEDAGLFMVTSERNLKDANPDVTVRLALLFYRDEGDEYVTRYFDFTEDIAAQRTNLAKQKSKGGGDYPEAVHTALHEAVNQQWSSGNTTKLIFHILDAPPHAQTAVGEVYRNAILTAAQKGIRIIPVASSGVDKETAVSMLIRTMSPQVIAMDEIGRNYGQSFGKFVKV